MGILAGIVSVNTYFTHRDTGSLAFKNFSTFFLFVFLFMAGTASLVYLSLSIDNTFITSGLIGVRVFVFIALMYLIQIPVFKKGYFHWKQNSKQKISPLS